MPTDSRKRGSAWASLRARVLMRDGRRCVVCGGEEQLQVDHIVELRDGGDDSMANLQTLCRRCHTEAVAVMTPQVSTQSSWSIFMLRS